MRIKTTDDQQPAIEVLEQLLKRAPKGKKRLIEQELRTLKAGAKGENNAAYVLDFHWGESKNSILIHDLRLEHGSRVAQIDHLLINRFLDVFVFETKHFHAGLKITEDGDFLRWNDYKKTYEGMPSPLAQNERHITVLKDVFGVIDMPTRLGMRLRPRFIPVVLVDPKARIDRPKGFDTRHVVKADRVLEFVETFFNTDNPLNNAVSLTKMISRETLYAIGEQLIAQHRPRTIDYPARFGIDLAEDAEKTPKRKDSEPRSSEEAKAKPANKRKKPQTKASQSAKAPEAAERPAASATPEPLGAGSLCRACQGPNLVIRHGKYGYYFKCRDCGGNTPIRVACDQKGHKARLRKDGLRFYKVCQDCEQSELFWENPVEQEVARA